MNHLQPISTLTVEQYVSLLHPALRPPSDATVTCFRDRVVRVVNNFGDVRFGRIASVTMGEVTLVQCTKGGKRIETGAEEWKVDARILATPL